MVIVKRPAECSLAELEVFCALARRSGEVATENLPQRVKRAKALALLSEGGNVIAIGAIKIPDEDYRRRTFLSAKAGAESEFPHELGWVFVSDEHQGRLLSRAVVEALLKGVEGNIYATSRSTKTPMHRTLRRFGFAQVGRDFPSKEHPEDTVILFTRVS